jgi:hypothetical protein
MRIRSLLLVPLATVAIYAHGGCSDGEMPPPSSSPAGYEDVLLEGGPTDETLVAFIQAFEAGPLDDVASQRAIFDWPADGEVLPKTPPTPFCWRFGATARLDAPARGASLDSAWAAEVAPLRPLPGAASYRSSTATTSAVAIVAGPLLQLFGPPRRAAAHGTPFSGVGTYVVFSVDGNPKLLRALTGDVQFQPQQAAWDEMAATGKPITVTLVSAIFEQNRVVQEGGPFVGSSITVTIAP